MKYENSEILINPYIALSITDILAGSGRALVYSSDLVFQRDVFGFPYIRGETVKGAIRGHLHRFFSKTFKGKGEKGDEVRNLLNEIFGDQEKAGSITFLPVYPLTIPISCLESIVAYITSPYLLATAAQILSKKREYIGLSSLLESIKM